jgi:hypothetical protein
MVFASAGCAKAEGMRKVFNIRCKRDIWKQVLAAWLVHIMACAAAAAGQQGDARAQEVRRG